MVTSITNLIKQKFKGEDNLTSTDLNVPDGARTPIDLNVSNKARSTSGDDQVSLQASNLFFIEALTINPKKMTGLMHLMRILIRPRKFPV